MAKNKRLSYLDRDIFTSPVHYTLCLSEEDFHKELVSLGVPVHEWGSWSSSSGNFGFGSARCHHLHSHGEHLAIVCLNAKGQDPSVTPSGVQIASLLVHEAVHIWQRVRDLIGESNPSTEFEAYSIQAIAQALMESYRDQTSDA